MLLSHHDQAGFKNIFVNKLILTNAFVKFDPKSRKNKNAFHQMSGLLCWQVIQNKIVS